MAENTTLNADGNGARPACVAQPGTPGVLGRLSTISHELRAHVPFTFAGTLLGIIVVTGVVYGRVPRGISEALFWTFHPGHVVLSALVTTAMFRRHSRRGLLVTLLIGYAGSVGIATVSDSLIPYVGERLLALPHAHPHVGFVEKWWLVNPLAVAGILLGIRWPRTKTTHAGHVLLSTAGSLFHVTMAVGESLSVLKLGAIGVFLFLAVWIPCCTSDIVFPLLFAGGRVHGAPAPHRPHHVV